jgi:hypothetical protein
MNLLECTTSIAIHSLIVSSCIITLGHLQKAYQKQISRQQETAEVMHALHIMTRSVHQAGFPMHVIDFPKINPASQSKKKIALQVRQNSGLNIHSPGEFIFRKGAHTVQDSDAMIIRHASLGHFDCLGHRITKERLQQGYAFQGFFAQVQGTGKDRSGNLMCQSLDSKGRTQNDSILAGLKSLKIKQFPNSQSHTSSHFFNHSVIHSIIQIELQMMSGQTYSRTVLTRHANHL